MVVWMARCALSPFLLCVKCKAQSKWCFPARPSKGNAEDMDPARALVLSIIAAARKLCACAEAPPVLQRTQREQELVITSLC